MRRSVVSGIKIALVQAGARLPQHAHYALGGVANYLWLGSWLEQRAFSPVHTVRDRYGLFDMVAGYVRGEHVVYLEFGVAHGASLRYWSRLLQHPDSELHGFDSFEGLPVDWILGRPAGHFSTSGRLPDIDDPRVQFHKGLFSDTLLTFTLPAHERLIVSLDADLYRSTVEVLHFLRDKVRSGTILYFDEFNHRADELRAFDEFLSETRIPFRLLAAVPDRFQVAFEALAGAPRDAVRSVPAGAE